MAGQKPASWILSTVFKSLRKVTVAIYYRRYGTEKLHRKRIGLHSGSA